MNSDKKAARIIGLLLLTIFILGVTIYQVLQGSVLFADDFLTKTASHSNQIILSTLLGMLSGILSIIISIILFPIVKRQSESLGYLYIAFCVLQFVGISIDNASVLSMLELSKEYVKNDQTDLNTLTTMGAVFYEKHRWTHYLSLLISCFPVFVLFYTLYFTRLIPKLLSIFGIIATILMFAEILFSIFEHSISMNMLLPIALIQLLFPSWLIIKGFNSQ